MKECNKCGILKDFTRFYKSKSNIGGLQHSCKECYKSHTSDYSKTTYGFITKIYGSQVSRSKKRGHQPPNYTKIELRDWVLSQPKFNLLWSNYVNSNYSKMLAPSCDRTDDYQGYDLNRLTLMTWGENNDKSKKDTRNGVLTKTLRVVLQYTKEGVLLKEWYSMAEAARKTGIAHQNISKCCRGKLKTSGGFIWKHKLKNIEN